MRGSCRTIRPARHGRSVCALASLLLGLALALLLGPTLASAQTPPSITYLRYDAEFDIAADGSFTVREIQQIRFDDRYTTAFAEIPLAYVTRIDDVQVREIGKTTEIPYKQGGSGPSTYSVDYGEDSVYVEWHFAPTEAGTVLTFVLQYRVIGGLWIYPDGDLLEWRAVPADRSGIPVLASRVVVRLPQPVPVEELRALAFGPEYRVDIQPAQVTFESQEPIPDGTRFQVQVGFPHGLVAARPQSWQIAEDSAELSYRFRSLDVDLGIAADGRVTIEERHRVEVEAGALYEGHRSISLLFLDNIENIQVWEGEQPLTPGEGVCEYCFTTERRGRAPAWARFDRNTQAVLINETYAGRVDLTWRVPALVAGEATTFRLRYDAVGALRLLDEGQVLVWDAVFAARDVPVESARLRLTLPPGISPQQVNIEGGAPQEQEDGTVLIEHEGPVPAGEPWQIRITLPPAATATELPRWQKELNATVARARAYQVRLARLRVLAVALSLFFLVGGLLGLLLLWYLWGRDRPVPLAPDYLPEPPSDLPPGIVAYLLDEQPTARAALASLFHLGILGLARIELSPELSIELNYPRELKKGQKLETGDGAEIEIPDHLVALYNSLFHSLRDKTPFTHSRAQYAFRHALPEVYAEMAEEVAPFFSELPAWARHRWLSNGQWLVLLAVVLAALGWLFYRDEVGWLVLMPAASLALVGVVLTLVSRWMPQRTPAGAEEAEKWRAFRRYLINLKHYADVPEAQHALDRYFDYAVALGVEEVLLDQAEQLGALMPIWTQPARVEPGVSHPAEETAETRPDERRADRTPHERLRVDTILPGGRRAPLTSAASWQEQLDDEARSRLSLRGLSHQMSSTLARASETLAQTLRLAAGGDEGDTPFTLVLRGVGQTAEFTWDVGTSTMDVLGDILKWMATSGGSGSYSDSSDRSSSWSFGRSSYRSSSSSSFRVSGSSYRSSSGRRSGGGGRRGFR